jgi:hypothetical protein
VLPIRIIEVIKKDLSRLFYPYPKILDFIVSPKKVLILEGTLIGTYAGPRVRTEG